MIVKEMRYRVTSMRYAAVSDIDKLGPEEKGKLRGEHCILIGLEPAEGSDALEPLSPFKELVHAITSDDVKLGDAFIMTFGED